jgi:acetyl esterase
MSGATGTERAPLGIRLLQGLRRDLDWSTMTPEELADRSAAENRTVASRAARIIIGFPDRGAVIRWREVALPGRRLRVRVHRPSPGRRGRGGDRTGLPLVLHVHGGGFVGTAVQSDWVNSHLAARLPAVVVSVEHRLLAPGIPMQAAADDGWEVLRHVVENAVAWGVDPARTAVFGESAGALIAALAALRARESGLALAAQVLVNPCVDLTPAMFDHDSITRHAHSPTLTAARLEVFRRLAAPPGTDPRAVSPLHADLTGLAPALVVVPTLDPVADHGRRYAERLRAAGTPVRTAEHPGATHAFLSTPGVVPQAKVARGQIAGFLRDRLVDARPGRDEIDGDGKR